MKTNAYQLFVLVLALLVAAPVLGQDEPLQLWSRFNTDDPQVTSDFWMQEVVEVSGVENTFYPYDQINSTLNVAVQSGAEVPDVAYVSGRRLGFYNVTGALEDLTDFVTNADWYDDLDPAALAVCTTPDGRILCVPYTVNNFFRYYWTDAYPDGLPDTTDALLEAAPAVQDAGLYAITFKGSEGGATERFYFPLITSFGAELADEDGRGVWANEEAVAAVEFIRELWQNQFVPEVILAPGFEYEEPFKQGQAGSFVAGSFSYVYLTPLQAPDGQLFEEEITGAFDPNALSVGDAYDAGALAFAPPLSAPDGEPVSFVSAEGWAIPYGSGDIEGAMAFIDSQMTAEANLAGAVSNGQFPVLLSALADETYATDYWQTAAQFKSDYGVGAPGWVDYDNAIRLLSIAVVNSITNPDADIMAELQAAQDEYNLGVDDL